MTVLWMIADSAHFDPVDEFDADWAKQCILDILNTYRWGIMEKIVRHGKERDLTMRLWRAIDISFDNLCLKILRSDQQSSASSSRQNEE
ncbi:hypothetical protein INT45_009867 [Circinella minor]|uniref:Uncharacterized protein n=1 Tax=Circinella minor TaxID=1195481 RepID=A0A8H7RYA7_9FUNG|nr:hypothetical protein INT45_009867 [Circinella minor]